MKKIFTLFAVAAMALSASAQEDGSLWLGMNGSNSTSKDIDGITCDGLEWAEQNVTMFLVKEDKSYSGGMTNKELGKPIKLSNGAPNVINLPEGFSTNKIEFYGYCNDKNVDNVAFISSITNNDNEALYTGTAEGTVLQNVAKLPGYDDFKPTGEKKADEFFGQLTLANMPKITCELSSAVSGQVWFKNGGKQPCLYIKIYKADSSSISDIVAEDAPIEYFNLQGIRVANPENGLFIKRQGNKVTKVIM